MSPKRYEKPSLWKEKKKEEARLWRFGGCGDGSYLAIFTRDAGG